MVKKKNRFAKKFIKKKKQTRGEAYAVLSPEERNREYFQALGSTRASVQMLGTAWAGIFVFLLDSVYIFSYIKNGLHIDPFSNFTFLSLCLYILSMIVCQFIFLKRN